MAKANGIDLGTNPLVAVMQGGRLTVIIDSEGKLAGDAPGHLRETHYAREAPSCVSLGQ